MKKAVVASLLMVASLAPHVSKNAFAQTDAAAPGAQAGQIQMAPAEYAAYNSAISQTTPQTKAPALEQYLTQYPQSAVKADVLTQLLQGKPNKEIARRLGLSVETVKDHVQAVLRALGVSSRTQAVLAVSQMTQQRLERRAIPR